MSKSDSVVSLLIGFVVAFFGALILQPLVLVEWVLLILLGSALSVFVAEVRS